MAIKSKMTLKADKGSRDRQILRILLIEGAVNIVIFTAKLWVGLSTGSMAIISDSAHSLSDIFNNLVALFAVRLSVCPPDREHPYGHKKFETIAVFFLGSMLVVIAFELALRAFTRDNTVEIVHSQWALTLMLLVLVGNISLATWQRIWAKRLQSDILLSDASHTLADVLTTIVVVISWQLSAMGYFLIDQLCTLLVSACILFLAYTLFKRSLPILVDGYSLDPQLLADSIMQIPGVAKVSRIRSRWIGSQKTVDLVIGVEPDISTSESHDIATEVEKLIEKEFDTRDTSVHVEPFYRA